jgi:hypothetical protein
MHFPTSWAKKYPGSYSRFEIKRSDRKKNNTPHLDFDLAGTSKAGYRMQKMKYSHGSKYRNTTYSFTTWTQTLDTSPLEPTS